MRLFFLTLAVGFCASGWAAEPAAARASAAVAAKGDDPATTLGRIRDAALKSDWALRRLAELTDKVGPRLSGSVQAQAAVALTANALKAAGLRVSLQPVVVPHWVRGEERGEVVDYPGRPAGVTQRLSLTALGGSSPTGPEGLTAPVLVVRSLAELERRAAEAKGKIVLVSVPFDQNLADNGEAGKAYSQGTEARFKAPAASAAVGAAASLVRSVGGADFRLPHTGFTRPGLDGGATAIPAAALTTEDALLLERLAAEGPVVVKLTLTPQTLPDVESSNVIAELPGRARHWGRCSCSSHSAWRRGAPFARSHS